ncbi:4'-phosphopantetheinyl transferase superfamily protein [Candidatus Pacearchaeota archaeon]|nr:4'-phosphopantetheinyl transferase superfamily protein [Candidatus Pacearchaeota archaeon]
MILGVGVDCEKTSRFKNIKKELSNKLFTTQEITYCNSLPNPEQHFAARFCGKEAVKKAFSSLDITLLFEDIEIIKVRKFPQVAFRNKGLNKKYKIHLSMSHSKDTAIAFAIVEDIWKKN